jgi:hypothetical protein
MVPLCIIVSLQFEIECQDGDKLTPLQPERSPIYNEL